MKCYKIEGHQATSGNLYGLGTKIWTSYMDLQYNPSAECCVVMLTLSLASIGQVIAFIMQICTESNKSKFLGRPMLIYKLLP